MTGSSTRCSRRLASALALAVWLLLAGTPLAARAQSADFAYAAVQAADDAYVFEGDLRFTLNERLEDAVQRGVALYLVLEVEISRARWYWFDERIVRRKRTYRLSYHPLTRTYRLTLGSLHQSFDTLDEALRPIARVRKWTLLPRNKLEAGQSYDVSTRFRLDTSLLPKPFQVTAIGSEDWTLDTDWLRWTFLATAPAAGR